MAIGTPTQETSSVKFSLIKSQYCEIDVAPHCNLSCRGCMHLSPVWSKEFIDPEVLRSDLGTMAKFYHTRYLGLVGGEPLLHPDILSVIAAVRESKISDRVSVTTNGVLLWKMPDEFWKAVDKVKVSVYPGKEMTPKQGRICYQKARQNNTSLHMSIKGSFQESYSEVGTNDRKMIKRIYDTCLIIHRWECHNIKEGYFYKCPQAVYLPKMLDGKFPSPHIDGIKIDDSPTFGEELRSYLESPHPLASCKYCLGSVGKSFAHSQVKRSEWRQLQQAKLEDMVDMELLTALEKDLDYREGRFRGFRSMASKIKLFRGAYWKINFLKYMNTKYGYYEALKLMFGREALNRDSPDEG